MNRILPSFLAALLAMATWAGPSSAAAVNTGHLTAELVAQDQSVAPGGTIQVALRQEIQKGWHTYWRNSGDSGEATQIAWTLPLGWKAGEFVWATPTRQPTGPLMNYGYKGVVLLPMTLTAPASARPGEVVTLKAAASFLVCEEICVPEDALLTLSLPVKAGPATPDAIWGPQIAKALAMAPKPGGLTASFQTQGGKLTLAVAGTPLAALDKADAYFYPFDSTVIDHAKAQTIERGPRGLTLSLPPGFAFQPPPSTTPAKPQPTSLSGVLVVADKAFEITAAVGLPPAGTSGLGAPLVKSASLGLGLIGAIGFAFVGGLILNLMPCVFPILAMKATSLAGHAHDQGAARAQGLAFLGGVMATFLALAGTLIAIRSGGAAIGWGFQLQSPPVVAVLSLLMLAVALNLSGVFEVGSSLQGVGTGLASRQGLIGAFFTGALAVVVAAPCTAPFMAPALGWALTQPAPAALAVFAGLGLGFAAPFTLAAFAPALLGRLPKPGAWMEGFRHLMAFPMYGAAAWLVWVLVVQAGPGALARILAAAVVLALAAWLAGIAQRRSGRLTGGAAILLVILAMGSAVWPAYDLAGATTSGSEAADATIPYQPYSPQLLADLRAQGHPVFVNYTAAWCVTCQVNEKVAFSSHEAAEAFKSTGAVYLKADWTRKDATIAADLAAHGRAGVPLYLVYDARGGEPKVLPQLLTGGIVKKALEAAT